MVLRGYAHVFEEQLGCVVRLAAEFFQVPATREPICTLSFKNQKGDAFGPLGLVGLGNNNDQVCSLAIGDENLRPVQHVLVADKLG